MDTWVTFINKDSENSSHFKLSWKCFDSLLTWMRLSFSVSHYGWQWARTRKNKNVSSAVFWAWCMLASLVLPSFMVSLQEHLKSLVYSVRRRKTMKSAHSFHWSWVKGNMKGCTESEQARVGEWVIPTLWDVGSPSILRRPHWALSRGADWLTNWRNVPGSINIFNIGEV